MQTNINLVNSSQAEVNNGEEVFLRSIPANIKLNELTPEALRLLVYYVSKQGPYELAIESGYFKGSLPQWLQSLKANFTLKATVRYYHELTQLTGLSEGDMVFVEETDLVYFYSGSTFPEKEKGMRLTGASAYQIALEQGFVGTPDEWLASLKGEPFRFEDFTSEQLDLITGPTGLSAYALAVEQGFKGNLTQWLDYLVGPKGDKGDKGDTGVNGKSAYQLAVDNGYQGTSDAWLASLKGIQGDRGFSAYDIALQDGYVGSPSQWLLSLEGDSAYEIAVSEGYQGTKTDWLESLRARTPYELAVQNGFQGSETSWLNSLKGKSAYELAVAKGYQGTEAQWLEFLRGKSAYAVAVDNGYTGSQEEWLASLKGASAYTLAVANGYEGSMASWLESLKGVKGLDGKSIYELAVDAGFVGTLEEWLAQEADLKEFARVAQEQSAISVNAVQQATTLIENATATIQSSADNILSGVDVRLAAASGGKFGFNTLAEFEAVKADLPETAIVTIAEAGANQGDNIWDGETLTLSPYDPVLQSKNYTDQSLVTVKSYTDQSLLTVKNDYLNLDQISDFRQSLTTGVFNPDFTTLSTTTLSFVDGQAVISQPTSTDFIRSIYTGRQIIDDAKHSLIFKFKTEDVNTTTGAAIFIGENIGIMYYSNGALAVVDAAFQTQSSQAITDVNLSYAAHESVELEIRLNGDGSGVAIARKANGKFVNLAFSGLQKGKIYLATRRLLANKSFTFEKFALLEKNITAQEITNIMQQSVMPKFDYTTEGFFSAVSDLKSSLYKYGLTDGKITIDSTSATSNAVFYVKTGAGFIGAAEFELASKVLGGTITAGMALVVGDSADRKIFAYLKNGLIGTLKSDGSLDQGSVNAAMAYTNEQTVKMRVAVSSDGDAILTAIHPDGRTATFKTRGVVAGNVYAAWRGSATTAEIHYLNKVEVSPSSVAMVAKIEQLSQQSKFPKTWRVLPDSEVGRTTKGFTCTGLAKITAGKYRECWAIGDDGRLEEADGSPYNPRIHILDGAFSRILLTIDPQYTSASLQGVTFDTITGGHVWAACSGNSTVRKFSLEVGSEGQEVVDDRINMSDLDLSITPNAIAFDSTRGTGKGALWLGDSVNNTVYLIDCDPAAVTRIIKTITLANNPDQFQLIDNTLLYQSGGNGSRASIYAYDLLTDTETSKWTQLECWFAAEGFYYDKTWRTLYAMNDAGYHKSISSGPRFNCVFEYILDF